MMKCGSYRPNAKRSNSIRPLIQPDDTTHTNAGVLRTLTDDSHTGDDSGGSLEHHLVLSTLRTLR